MKLGDLVYSKEVRSDEQATVVKIDISNRLDLKTRKSSTRTKYEAVYPDGSTLVFYGAQINHTIFRFRKKDGQMCLSDFIVTNNDF